MSWFSKKKESNASVPEAPKTETRVKAGEAEMSYQDIGKERAQKAKEFITGGLKGLTEKLGSGLSWLGKKAEQAVYGALAAPEAIGDAGKATGKAVGNTAREFGAGAKELGVAVKESVVETGQDLRSAGQFVGEKVVGGAQAVGRAAREDWNQTGEDFKSVGRGIKGGVEAGARFVGDKVTEARLGYERAANRGRELAYNARERVNGAIDSFNAWRNEQRMKRAAELLGVTPDKIVKLQALLANI